MLGRLIRREPDKQSHAHSVSSLSALAARTCIDRTPSAEGAPPSERRSRPRVTTKQPAILHRLGENQEHLKTPVEIVDRSPNGMGILLPLTLPVGLTVWLDVRDNDESLKCVVRHSTRIGETYFAGLFQVHFERRRLDRQIEYENGTISWEDSERGDVTNPAILRNVSEEGFQLEVAKALPLQAVVKVSFEGWECFGSTRYCKTVGDKHLVGLQLIAEPHRKDAAASQGSSSVLVSPQ